MRVGFRYELNDNALILKSTTRSLPSITAILGLLE